jgi:hypothetical protein
MSDPHAWGFTADDLAAIAGWNLGFFADALGHAERALAMNPGDARLQANVALIARSLAGKAGEISPGM